MQIDVAKLVTGTRMDVTVRGRIDTNTAPKFGGEVMDDLDGIKELVLDFSAVEYISSIGLRVVLELQKKMNNQGSMKIIDVTPQVMEVFEMTGFTNILTIENTEENG